MCAESEAAVADSPAPTAKPADPPAPTDAELERLQLEAAKIKVRKEIADAQQAALGSLAPSGPDTPTGQTTVGADAGALAPWLTYHVLDEAAAEVIKDLARIELGGKTVLVTEDPHLLASDVFGRQVMAAMTARTDELAAITDRLGEAGTALAAAVAAVSDLEAGAGGTLSMLTDGTAAPAAGGAEADQAGAAEATDTPATTDTTTSTPASSAIDAAVSLARLVAVDYTITAAKVPAEPALLATLVAGALRRSEFERAHGGPIRAKVLLDNIGVVVDDDPTFGAYEALTRATQAVDAAVLDLRGDLGPVTAEIDLLTGEVDKLQAQWTAATADKDAARGGAARIKAVLDLRRSQLIQRKDAAAPALAIADRADALLVSARSDLTALITPDASGLTPLVRTCSRNGLFGSEPAVDYVLYVDITHLGADTVTRHSLLGSSGRVGYLGSATTSWTLVETSTGQVKVGGATRKARQLVHDLASGMTSGSPIANATISLPNDPQAKLETQVRWAVLIFALAVALLGIAATLNVFFG